MEPRDGLAIRAVFAAALALGCGNGSGAWASGGHAGRDRGRRRRYGRRERRRPAAPAAAASGGDAAGSAAGSAGCGWLAGAGGSSAWVMGYWAVWQTTQYPLAHVAWGDMTHAALSFVEPRAPVATTSASPYATLDSSNAVANLGASGMSDFATAAHAGGAHPIISLGGAGAGAGFAAAAAPPTGAARQRHRRRLREVGLRRRRPRLGRSDRHSPTSRAWSLALRAAAPRASSSPRRSAPSTTTPASTRRPARSGRRCSRPSIRSTS